MVRHKSRKQIIIIRMAALIPLSSLTSFSKFSCRFARIARNKKAALSWRYCSTYKAGLPNEKINKNLEELYVRPEVQSILKKITGFNLEKIFRERQTLDLEAPKYKLLTDKQLIEYQEEAIRKGHEVLQMPPVKLSWSSHEPEKQILSADLEISDFDTSGHCYVFTDITYSTARRNRTVVIREPDGILRFANHEERDRTLQVYYPAPGKMYHMPKMFEEDKLEKVLAEHRYEYILDRACVQFEPDDPNYVRVTQRTYEHIASYKKFDDLRSTRHFGPMAFYFAFYQKIDLLLLDMLQSDFLKDAFELIKLYHMIHPECQSAKASQQKTDGVQLIQLFAKYDAQNGSVLEMALQSYEEAHTTFKISDIV